MSSTKLPRGIYYEAARKRYRVRLYWDRQVEHLSYHETLEEAIAELTRARVRIYQLRRENPSGRRAVDLGSAEAQVRALLAGAA